MGHELSRGSSCALLLAGLVGLAGCGSDEAMAGAYVYENPIFPGTSVIGGLEARAGSHSNRPTFSWPATGYRHVVCGVFDERIGIYDGRISNPHRLRWAWHSGLSTGREGLVLFENGVSDPESGAPARDLQFGTYYWAVWTLDAQGRVAGSSLERTLTIPLY